VHWLAVVAEFTGKIKAVSIFAATTRYLAEPLRRLRNGTERTFSRIVFCLRKILAERCIALRNVMLEISLNATFRKDFMQAKDDA